MSAKVMRFRASISKQILQKAPRFFNGTFDDIFNELLQNCRRAGAKQVAILAQHHEKGGGIVTIRDDGCGLGDPKAILTLGGSDWEEGVKKTEDPAGAGFYALASRGATIYSRAKGRRTGWRMELSPAQFNGEAEVEARAAEMDEGTEISFPFDAGEKPERAASAAAEHFPLPVTFNGEPVVQNPFLKNAVRTERWRGLTIGIFKGSDWRQRPNINFHGVILRANLPSIDDAVEGSCDYHVKIDVVSCPELQLVLPARKEVVQNAFLDELKLESERVIFRTIAELPEHDLGYEHWRRAKALGIALKEAKARLHPFQAIPAHRDYFEPARPVDLPADNAVVLQYSDETPFEQCFVRALERAGSDLLLLRPEPRYVGYAWYDRLTKIIATEWRVRHQGVETRLEDFAPAENQSKVDSVHVMLTLSNADRSTWSQRADADVIFQSEDVYDVTEAAPLIAADAPLTPDELAALIVDSYFVVNDDHEAGSYDHQRQYAEDEAQWLALNLLASHEAAEEAALKDELGRHVMWRLPKNRRTVIVHEGLNFRIRYRPLSIRERFRRLHAASKKELPRRIDKLKLGLMEMRNRLGGRQG